MPWGRSTATTNQQVRRTEVLSRECHRTVNHMEVDLQAILLNWRRKEARPLLPIHMVTLLRAILRTPCPFLTLDLDSMFTLHHLLSIILLARVLAITNMATGTAVQVTCLLTE